MKMCSPKVSFLELDLECFTTLRHARSHTLTYIADSLCDDGQVEVNIYHQAKQEVSSYQQQAARNTTSPRKY